MVKAQETCDGCSEPTCDARIASPVRSRCNAINFGSFDAWVARFERAVTATTDPAAFAMLATPRHSFGADNLLGHVFEAHLNMSLSNRCHRYKISPPLPARDLERQCVGCALLYSFRLFALTTRFSL